MRLIIFKDGSMSLRSHDNTMLHNGEPEIVKEIDLSTLSKHDLGLIVDNLGNVDKINQVLEKYGLAI